MDNSTEILGMWSEPQGSPTYDEQLREWARSILADQTPVKGGFAPAPLFPLPPAEEGGCDE